MSKSPKTLAQLIVNRLADDAGWDEIMYALHVARKIDRALEGAAAGYVVPHEEIRREFCPD